MTKSTEVSLEKKIHFLKQPQHYPEKTTEITIKETHMSMVFLTDKFVYKLKKTSSL